LWSRPEEETEPLEEMLDFLEDGHSQVSSRQPLPYRREDVKVGRNDPCPCGSGRKYKFCCMLKN
ncbi:MAG: SEC-C metal-binding domain-containing protein, partial [Candidatus Entotheonellia bacterium]